MLDPRGLTFLSLATIALALATPSPAAAADRLQAVTEAGTPGRIVLVEERVSATIDDQYVQATLRGVYQNEDDVVLEGQYNVTVGDDATVEGFAYWNGESKIVGEVFEKDTATAVYEEVTGLGRDPGLLEQHGEGSFGFRVFPIAPGERKPVEVDVGAYLRRVGNTVQMRLPVESSDAEVSIVLNDTRGVGDVRSSSHEIELERVSPGALEVRARRSKASTDAFVLEYDLDAQPWTLSTAMHRDSGYDGFVHVSLATPTEVAAGAIEAKDVTLVLDRSGSMEGAPLAQAKTAAANIIRRLRAEDRVNVVLFDDGVESLFPMPQKVTAKVREQATMYIGAVNDGGGTNIAGAIKEVLARQLEDAQPDIVMFLTDGQSDAQQALDEAKRASSRARLFTVGLGSGVERSLLSRLASLRRGRFTYIESASAIPAKMSQLYTQIESPLLVDLELELEGATLLRAYPRTLPDLFVGDELRVAARVRGEGPATLRLKGVRDGKPFVVEAAVEIPAAADRGWVGRRWGKARVDDLLEEIALHGSTHELRNEALELALAYDLVTPFTSFLAIPASELTETAAQSLEQARQRKAAIKAAHPDAVALSRRAMPPGDPVLSLRAPADAQQVTAYFPFGLVKDLQWDPELEQWTTRFLVPNRVSDGEYAIQVVIVHADGTTEIATVDYTIDSEADPLHLSVEVAEGGVRLLAHSDERLREVVGIVGGMRFSLEKTSDDGQTYGTTLDLPPGSHTVVVVATDLARNESEQRITVEVTP